MVQSAINSVGLDKKIQELENGLNTEYTREFNDNGTEFSGGQAQKLAIARAIYQDADIMIMDEPSSALDPISEEKMIHTIFEASKDKTLILISHKLSSVKDVERIIVMDNGEIIEEGSHKQLMEQGGKYEEMFTLQAHRYGDSE